MKFLLLILLFGTNLCMANASPTADVNLKDNTCYIEGVAYPAVGFGTYPLKDDVCEKAVSKAAQLGYRIIDTATFYQNFIPIGKVMKQYGRQNFYIISKVWPNAQTRAQMRNDINRTLQQLQTNYLDAYLLHWPNSKISIEESLSTMEELRSKKLIRHIGLSNVTVNHLKRAMELNIPITWVQVEMNPFFYDPELLKFCEMNSITVQAWGPLGEGRIVRDPMLTRIGEKYGKTASQVAIRWILQHKCLPLPSSKNEAHIKQNLEVFDFMLTKEDMDRIDARAKTGQRMRIPTDEFDYSYEQCWPRPQQ